MMRGIREPRFHCISKIPCTSRDHICGLKIHHQKTVSIHFPTHAGATKIEVHAKVFNTLGNTSVMHEFPNRKLF
jgi:hypothetical protein